MFVKCSHRYEKSPILGLFLLMVPIPRVELGADPYQGPVLTVILYRLALIL